MSVPDAAVPERALPAWPLWLLVAGVAGDLACLAAFALAGWRWLALPATAFTAAWLLGLGVLRNAWFAAHLRPRNPGRKP